MSEETLSITDFKVAGWSSNERLVEVNSLFKKLKKSIKEIQKRDYLSITPKVEEPNHKSMRKEMGRGRLLFYVTFEGGTAYLDLNNLVSILEIDETEL